MGSKQFFTIIISMTETKNRYNLAIPASITNVTSEEIEQIFWEGDSLELAIRDLPQYLRDISAKLIAERIAETDIVNIDSYPKDRYSNLLKIPQETIDNIQNSTHLDRKIIELVTEEIRLTASSIEDEEYEYDPELDDNPEEPKIWRIIDDFAVQDISYLEDMEYTIIIDHEDWREINSIPSHKQIG